MVKAAHQKMPAGREDEVGGMLEQCLVAYGSQAIGVERHA
jgi:hypothetical protein